jgi:hypothetical protein
MYIVVTVIRTTVMAVITTTMTTMIIIITTTITTTGRIGPIVPLDQTVPTDRIVPRIDQALDLQ